VGQTEGPVEIAVVVAADVIVVVGASVVGRTGGTGATVVDVMTDDTDVRLVVGSADTVETVEDATKVVDFSVTVYVDTNTPDDPVSITSMKQKKSLSHPCETHE
jgi:hypothetical protein